MCYDQFSRQFEAYLGNHLTDYFIYMVAECLDTRTFLTLTTDDNWDRVLLMETQGLCTEYERTGRNEALVATTSSVARGVRGRGGRGGSSVVNLLTPEEILQERLTGTPKTAPPLRLEYSSFVCLMKKKKLNVIL